MIGEDRAKKAGRFKKINQTNGLMFNLWVIPSPRMPVLRS